jgi:hypothetical protein
MTKQPTSRSESLSNSRCGSLSLSSTARVNSLCWATAGLGDGRLVTAEMVQQWCDEILQLGTLTTRDYLRQL